jgi:hypothetical protein
MAYVMFACVLVGSGLMVLVVGRISAGVLHVAVPRRPVS